MKNIDDEHIEKLLFEALKKEPETGLPFDFAAMITRKAHVKPAGFKSHVIAVLASITIISVVGLALFLFDPAVLRPLFFFLISVKYILISVIVGYLMIEYLDQKFVKRLLLFKLLAIT